MASTPLTPRNAASIRPVPATISGASPNCGANRGAIRNATADKATAHEGGPRKPLAWFEQYVGLLTAHPGAASRVTTAIGDEASPIASKCEIHGSANGRVLGALRAGGAVRESIDVLQVLRLIGGIAAVADQGRLGPEPIRPTIEVVGDGVLRS